jgi:EAL domain-containing protein (putative c-di-GMP-specific phosphodiesterase class I)
MGQDDSANRLAERIQAGLQRPFKVEGHELHMSASIGVVTDVAHYERAGDLLRDADLAMYEAKSRGKARFESFDVEMRNQAFLRLDIEGELRKGLEKDELHVHYQPVISLKTGRIVSFEALVRWMHPTRGLLLPRQFLAVAEETGLILPMGEHVLHTACSDMQGFHDDNPDARSIGVSVNISNKQFTQPGLKGVVEKAVAQSGLDPRRLRLEITERVLIGNLRTASRVFADLRGMGVRFDIDDFGTGYSALAYLQNFPIQALKIDRGFIENMQRDRKGLGLVRAIVSMAHELGMETVAEGVTNNRQLRRLKALGCDYAQGTLMSRPLRPRGVEQLLQQTAGGSKRLVIRTSASPRKTASRSSSRSAPGSVRAHAARVGASRRRRSR